ncbi:hypothetical protein CSKR_102986 [Clonorchis sinensis]|uniref:Uncharacterized protein n=1 Tax=Clonorchis sinensis TaxID=79923 RepID=A0A3R7GEH2_CLOSI|nr:hypothetical protein CSKR_102986 [Clonorchis sinensis]
MMKVDIHPRGTYNRRRRPGNSVEVVEAQLRTYVDPLVNTTGIKPHKPPGLVDAHRHTIEIKCDVSIKRPSEKRESELIFSLKAIGAKAQNRDSFETIALLVGLILEPFKHNSNFKEFRLLHIYLSSPKTDQEQACKRLTILKAQPVWFATNIFRKRENTS